jgi:NTP pyrophosphatase (non-canonical NTP hydrolase)
MTDRARQDALNYICQHYGFFNQRDMLVEEAAELIQSVSKCKRNVTGAWDNFIEETADVYVLLHQMIDIIGEEKFMTVVDDKINRQVLRINNEENY